MLTIYKHYVNVNNKEVFMKFLLHNLDCFFYSFLSVFRIELKSSIFLMSSILTCRRFLLGFFCIRIREIMTKGMKMPGQVVDHLLDLTPMQTCDATWPCWCTLDTHAQSPESMLADRHTDEHADRTFSIPSAIDTGGKKLTNGKQDWQWQNARDTLKQNTAFPKRHCESKPCLILLLLFLL